MLFHASSVAGIKRLEPRVSNHKVPLIYFSSKREKKELADIPFAYTSDHPVDVEDCEYIPDAYEAIMQAVDEGKIVLEKYEAISPNKKKWIENTMKQEYHSNQITEEYQYFLTGKFDFLHRSGLSDD